MEGLLLDTNMANINDVERWLTLIEKLNATKKL